MATKILDLELTRLDEAVEVGAGYRHALLLLRWCGRPLGQQALEVREGRISRRAVVLAAARFLPGRLPPSAVVALIPELAETPPPDLALPSCSVVVCTHDRPDDLRHCLDSLMAAGGASAAVEVVVVDNAPPDDRTERLAAGYPVRYVRELRWGHNWARSLGARSASGEVVIYTDDDLVVDFGWLDALRRPFADPAVGAVTGLVMPAELETEAQELFERTNGFGRGFDLRRYTAATAPPCLVARVGAGASMAIRRELVIGLGLFDVELGYGTAAITGDDHYAFYRLLSTGHPIVYNPEAVSWHRHRRSREALRRTVRGYSVGAFCYLLRTLVVHGEVFAPRVCLWWFLNHHMRQLLRGLLRRADAQPLDLTLAEIRGTLTSPWAFLISLARGRRRAALPPSRPPHPAFPG